MIVADDEQPRRETGDDFVTEPLGRFGAGGHRLLAGAQLAERLFHGGSHERGLGAGVVLAAGHLPRGGEQAEHRESERRHEDGDRRGQREQDQG